jgi:NADH-quinone oxidoreductase subunit E
LAPRRLAEVQPETFAFTPENEAWAQREIAKYPPGRQASAVIALLWQAQEQHGGWLPEPAIRLVADLLDMAYIRVLEVATFYTMFNLAPVGRAGHIMVCGTTPCMLRGAEELKAICRDRVAPAQFEVSADGLLSWEEVECLGACVNAPMVQVGADTFEDLTPESFTTLLADLAAGRPVRPGPQVDRQFSAPEGGDTTLLDIRHEDDHSPSGGPLTDRDPKRPGEAANVREAAVPKPPIADASDTRNPRKQS